MSGWAWVKSFKRTDLGGVARESNAEDDDESSDYELLHADIQLVLADEPYLDA